MAILQDKVVLVTGRGPGSAAPPRSQWRSPAPHRAAADIDSAAAQRTADQAAGNVRRAIAIEADCGDVASIDAMVARAVAELGRLDVIVNNAGVTRYAQIMDLTEADWDRIHRVNAKGVFFCLQRAARVMIRQNQTDGSGGRIINIASISGRGYPGASNAAYAASKGAVISMTWMAAQQLGRHNINVNAICPGVTRTDLGARNAEARAAERGITIGELQAEAEARIPIGRANTPGGHRRDGGVPCLARRPQHHRPSLQRRRRPGPELMAAGKEQSSPPRKRGSRGRPLGACRSGFPLSRERWCKYSLCPRARRLPGCSSAGCRSFTAG